MVLLFILAQHFDLLLNGSLPSPAPSTALNGQPRMTSQTSSNVSLVLSPPSLLERNGIIKRYELHYRRTVTAGQEVQSSDGQQVRQIDVGQTQDKQDMDHTIALRNLKAGSEYNYTVRTCVVATLDSEKCTLSSEYTFTTLESGKQERTRAVTFQRFYSSLSLSLSLSLSR